MTSLDGRPGGRAGGGGGDLLRLQRTFVHHTPLSPPLVRSDSAPPAGAQTYFATVSMSPRLAGTCHTGRFWTLCLHSVMLNNAETNEPIIIIFGVWNSEEISQQEILNSPTYPEQCFCATLRNTTHLTLLVR